MRSATNKNSFRNLFLMAVVALAISAAMGGCKKGSDYCPDPQPVSGIKALEADYPPTQAVVVELEFPDGFGQDFQLTTTLFCFTTPPEFENPKGDYPVDIVDKPTYTYMLKNPANAPASVEIRAYAFNDCGQGEEVTAVIRYR